MGLACVVAAKAGSGCDHQFSDRGICLASDDLKRGLLRWRGGRVADCLAEKASEATLTLAADRYLTLGTRADFA